MKSIFLFLFLMATTIGWAAKDSTVKYSIHEIGFAVTGGFTSGVPGKQDRKWGGEDINSQVYIKGGGSVALNYTVHIHKFVSVTVGLGYRIIDKKMIYSYKGFHYLPYGGAYVYNIQAEMLHLPVRLNMHFGKNKTNCYLVTGADFNPLVYQRTGDTMLMVSEEQITKARGSLIGVMVGVGVEQKLNKGSFMRVYPSVNFFDLASPGLTRYPAHNIGLRTTYTYIVGLNVEFGFLIKKAIKQKV